MRNRYSISEEDLLAEAEDVDLQDVFRNIIAALKLKYKSIRTQQAYIIRRQGARIAELKTNQPPPIPSEFVKQDEYQTLEKKYKLLQDEYATLSLQYHEERRKNSPDKEMVTALQMHNANLQDQLRKYRDYYNQHIAKYNIEYDPKVTIGEPIKLNSSKPKSRTKKKKMTYGNRSYNNKSKKKSRVKKRR